MKSTSKFAILALTLISILGYAEEKPPVFTQSGDKDPTFAELLETHGEKDKDGNLLLSRTKPILGAKIDVDNAFLEEGLGKVSNPHKVFRNLRIKSAMGNIPVTKAEKDYTRWYQMDGDTQIFRLFKGDKDYRQTKACRSECFSGGYPTKDQIVVWEGSYYVPSAFNGPKGSGGIAFQLGMHGGKVQGLGYPWVKVRAGIVYNINHRYQGMQKPWSGDRTHSFLSDALDKRVIVRFRYDGHYYDLSIRSPEEEFKVIDGGTLPCEERVAFRWGVYTGQSEDGATANKLIFVTGAKVYTEKGAITPPAWVPKECLTKENETKPNE